MALCYKKLGLVKWCNLLSHLYIDLISVQATNSIQGISQHQHTITPQTQLCPINPAISSLISYLPTSNILYHYHLQYQTFWRCSFLIESTIMLAAPGLSKLDLPYRIKVLARLRVTYGMPQVILPITKRQSSSFWPYVGSTYPPSFWCMISLKTITHDNENFWLFSNLWLFLLLTMTFHISCI